jgi:hypothetical protein
MRKSADSYGNADLALLSVPPSPYLPASSPALPLGALAPMALPPMYVPPPAVAPSIVPPLKAKGRAKRAARTTRGRKRVPIEMDELFDEQFLMPPAVAPALPPPIVFGAAPPLPAPAAVPYAPAPAAAAAPAAQALPPFVSKQLGERGRAWRWEEGAESLTSVSLSAQVLSTSLAGKECEICLEELAKGTHIQLCYVYSFSKQSVFRKHHRALGVPLCVS